MNGIDYILIVILTIVIGGALYKIYRDRKHGKCCNCSGGNCECCGGKK